MLLIFLTGIIAARDITVAVLSVLALLLTFIFGVTGFSSWTMLCRLASSCISSLAGKYQHFLSYFCERNSRNLASLFAFGLEAFSRACNQTLRHNCNDT